jgi:hypothetical protein
MAALDVAGSIRRRGPAPSRFARSCAKTSRISIPILRER